MASPKIVALKDTADSHDHAPCPSLFYTYNQAQISSGLTDEVQNVTHGEVCFTAKELHEVSNLYKQNSTAYVWEWTLGWRIMEGT